MGFFVGVRLDFLLQSVFGGLTISMELLKWEASENSE